ncbi:uncharacterized protein Z518_08487 [Rhinocladiella mackenziei CBS 650.93]|uniref:Rhinocladiella mackenziei CBS 650.93 unplaced genomic scaffold supercont1.6, whole genome shotgun sequence n=1 Tax=Rhinocladiella mackenziei CBS 650.93 TaxID=1442369 RepID=A0A0D2IGY7_9EURO|nr:uncharacterized protein Z518_08487 [Rhinocladiella mackenziei CBS 650.93]KIX02546.1 hypothetical protein Z518_08487 [Rhinocladiella mackenziei CBS 650.93]
MSTSTRSSKRQKAGDHEKEYRLLYWAGLPGRGEHIRLAFEATGTPYVDVSNSTSAGVDPVLAQISDKYYGDEHNPPAFAPPLLQHGPDITIAQTPNILMYLGPRLGLVPNTDDDPLGIYHVNSLTLTALDGLSNEPHDVHHPIASGKYYEEQKAEALKKAEDYRTVRLPKFLGYFERVLRGKASGGEWLYGGKLTYADLVLFQTLDGVMHAFPKCMGRIREEGKYEKVFALYERVKGLERIQKYLGSKRRLKYGMGIYRHYPELDEA